MSFNNLSNNSDYMVVSSNEVASIISKFTPDMILDIIENAMDNKYKSYSPKLVNIIESLETDFISSINQLPEYKTEIKNTRDDIYRQILTKILQLHDLSLMVNIYDISDIYSAAYIIYDFLIANFAINITNFFINYIYKEKNTLYESVKLAEKRNELSSYTKMVFKNNTKIGLIHANLDLVINNICSYDIDFQTFVNVCYINDRQRAQMITSIIGDCGDFFRRHIIPYYINNPIINTNIKFGLQDLKSIDIMM